MKKVIFYVIFGIVAVGLTFFICDRCVRMVTNVVDNYCERLENFAKGDSSALTTDYCSSSSK